MRTGSAPRRATQTTLALRFRVTNVTQNGRLTPVKTFTIRDFRSRPRQVQEAVKRETEAVLTSNGRPFALLVTVDAGSLDEELAALRDARAARALDALRAQAAKTGTDRIGPDEIDRVIRKSRRARRGSATARP